MSISLIKKMEEMAKELPDVISLSQGIPSGNSHKLIRDYVIDSLKKDNVDKYSEVAGLLKLRKLISENQIKKGLRYSPDNEIIVTAGGMSALSSILLGLIENKDEVIIFTPTYSYYSKIVRLAKGVPIELSLVKPNWEIDFDLLKEKISKKTKGIIICNPNNPTGHIYSKEELYKLGEIVKKNNLILISDDVYENLYFEEPPFNLASDSKFKEHIIRVVSLSKDFNLTGWRIGYINCPKKYYEKILGTHDTLVNCAPVISQYAGIAALKNEDIILGEMKGQYKKNKRIVEKYLSSLADYLSYTSPEGTYYIFPEIRNLKNSEEFCMNMLIKSGVSVVPGIAFGKAGEGHLRICFGREVENIEEGMTRFRKYFQNNI